MSKKLSALFLPQRWLRPPRLRSYLHQNIPSRPRHFSKPISLSMVILNIKKNKFTLNSPTVHHLILFHLTPLLLFHQQHPEEGEFLQVQHHQLLLPCILLCCWQSSRRSPFHCRRRLIILVPSAIYISPPIFRLFSPRTSPLHFRLGKHAFSIRHSLLLNHQTYHFQPPEPSQITSSTFTSPFTSTIHLYCWGSLFNHQATVSTVSITELYNLLDTPLLID